MHIIIKAYLYDLPSRWCCGEGLQIEEIRGLFQVLRASLTQVADEYQVSDSKLVTYNCAGR